MTPMLPILMGLLAVVMIGLQVWDILMHLANNTGSNVPEMPSVPPMPPMVKRMRTDWNRIMEETKLEK